MSKETILRSKKFPNLIVQIFDDKEFGMIGENEKLEPEKLLEKDFFIDNIYYAKEVYKLLKEADKRGCFDFDDEDSDKEEILI